MAAKPTIRPLQLQTCREQKVEQEQIFLAEILFKEKKKHPGWRRTSAGGQRSHGLIYEFYKMPTLTLTDK